MNACPLRFAALAILAALFARPAPAHGYCRTTTSPAQPDPTMCPARGVPIAWPFACVGIHIDPTVLPPGMTALAVRTVTNSAANAWGDAVCDPARGTHPGFRLHLREDLTEPVGYFDGASNVNSIVFRVRWADDPFHPPDAAAVTIVTFGARSASILDTDTELNLRGPVNPRGMVFTVADGDPSGADLQTILTHELGHTQGLAHSAERRAVMWFSAGRGEQRRVPTADDAQGICAVYPPRDTSACDSAARWRSLQGGGLDCASRPGASGVGGACALVVMALAAALTARRRR